MSCRTVWVALSASDATVDPTSAVRLARAVKGLGGSRPPALLATGAPVWDGEDGLFDVRCLDDLDLLPNLKLFTGGARRST